MIDMGDRRIVPIDVDQTLLMWDGIDWTPNYGNINALIREYKRGKFVIVWSRAGGKAAKIAVKNLGLEKYVHLVCAKPDRYIDDRDATEWMERSYYTNDQSKKD